MCTANLVFKTGTQAPKQAREFGIMDVRVCIPIWEMERVRERFLGTGGEELRLN